MDVVVLNRAPLALRYSVYRAGCPLFERDPGAAHIFKARSLGMWLDFEQSDARAFHAAMFPSGHG